MPEDNRNLFKPSDHFLEAAFTGLASYAGNPVAFLKAWKESGDTLVEEAVSRARGQRDYFFPVIAYLYRHYVELALKLTVRWASRLGGKKPPGDLTGTHDLACLLAWADQRLKDVSGESLNQETRKQILEMHEWDPSGQRFRYFTKKDGTVSLKEDAVKLEGLKEAMDGVQRHFWGVHGWLIEALEAGP